jgi:hypothetical protein
VSRFLIAALFTISATAAAQAPTLARVATIGCSECGGAAQFATIRDVVLLPSGDVLTVNSEAPTLRAFRPDGTVLWTSGRDGAGPGEYRNPMRAVSGPDGIQVVDMTLRRVTRLGADGGFLSATQIGGFPAAANGRGNTLIIVTDDFRGTKTLHRWAFSDSGRRIGVMPSEEQAGVIFFASVAVAPSGDLAVLSDGNVYEIHRMRPDGSLAGTWSRHIDRVKRTPDEIAALELVRQRARGQAAVEARAGRGRAPTPRPAGTDELKPHVAIDGLRFDDSGRLWVRTMRGDHTRTILDVFSPSGTWLGEVVVPFPMGAFSLAGRWLAADVEAEDGTRRVMIWEVR